MMLVLFRSGLFGILAMLPLTVTIVFIYGLIGWIGKDYDMPVAILSAMTLGLSVDFAIHFLERGREMYKKTGNWKEANQAMFRDPAKAISRNAIVISLGFMPLLLAPLIPYRTVGIFLALICWFRGWQRYLYCRLLRRYWKNVCSKLRVSNKKEDMR
jgi:predicted RND superfamily exporter protein